MQSGVSSFILQQYRDILVDCIFIALQTLLQINENIFSQTI